MKLLTNKTFVQKIILVLVAIILFNFAVPIQSNAAVWDLGTDLLKELVHLITSLGDVIMGALNKMMLGTEKMLDSAMLPQDDPNFRAAGSDLNGNTSLSGDVIKRINTSNSTSQYYYPLDGLLWNDWKVPNMLYSPENIFANRIAMLDVNFVQPHTYNAVEYHDEAGSSATQNSQERAQSGADKLNETVASWYKSFRNIAIVGLLTVLVYLGIRILIASTVQDKAKYKENLQDWLVALCLVFAIHFIMSGIMMLTDKVTDLFDTSVNNNIVVHVKGDDVNVLTPEGAPTDTLKFRTNLTGYMRFMAQSDDLSNTASYSIIYLALVIYTVMFTVIYLKRFLYMAFFTMIAPLVALTYPIDKANDGKAQAFNLWFKEYTMNAIIQPVHLILYTALVGTAIDLASSNPIYALVAIGFLIPAEKFVKKMFGLDRSETAAGWGAVAGGALAMKGVGKVAGSFKGNKGKGSKNDEDSESDSTIGRGSSPRYSSSPLTSIFGAGAPREISAQTTANEQSAGNTTRNSENPNEIGPTTDNGNPNPNPAGATGDPGQAGPTSQGNSDQGGPATQTIPETDAQRTARERAERQRVMDDRDEWTRIANDPNTSDLDRDEALDHVRMLDQQQAESDRRARQRGFQDTGFESGSETANRSFPTYRRDGTLRPATFRGTRFGAGVSAVASQQARKIKNAVEPRNVGKKLYRGGKKAAKMAVKAGGMALAGAAIGTVAAAAALTTGDMSKGASILGAGAALTYGAGGWIGDKVNDRIESKSGEITDTFKNAYYSSDEQKAKKQEKFDRDWKKNEENYKFLQNKIGMSSKEAKQFMQSEETQKFLDADITDINTIYNARQLAKDKGYSIDHAIARAELSETLSKDFKKNYSEQESFRKRMMSQNSNVSPDQANNLIDDMKALKKDRRK